MAYGLKYELLCTSKKGNAYKLKLLFEGYPADSDIDRNIPGDSPLVLRKDKAAVIRGTSLDFGIREAVDFELDEFYTNNPKKIKAELYKDTTLLWTGYNLPQQYEAPYIPSPVSIRFTATDGLGLLKNEKYNQTGTNSQLATIIYCVDKIGLALGYSIAINLFETTHDHALSPLAQTFEDSSIFNGLDCYTVIEKILNKYDAEITQVNGRWHITRSVDKKSTRMLYTTAGVYETTAAAPAVLDLGYPGAAGIEVWPVGQLGRSLEPGAKQVTIEHDFGRKGSLLDNYEFWRYAGGAFTGWSKVGTFDTLQRIKDGKAYAFLSGYSADDTMQIYQTIPVANVAGDDFVFEINIAPIGRTGIPARREVQTIQMTVRMAVVLFDGATYYWLSKTEGWVTTPTLIEEVLTSSLSSPVWNTIKIMTDELPASGNLTVAMYRFYSATAPGGGVSYTGIALSEPSVYFLNAGELYPSGLKTTAVFDNSTEPNDLGTVPILAADAPDYLNTGQLYLNITRLSGGAPTTGWHVLGEVTEYSQVIQLARTLASNNRRARQVLKGTIKGTGINFDSIIKHAYNGNKEFEISEVQWDLYNESYQVTLLELLAWSSETITFTTENENTNSASATSGGSIIGVALGNDAGISLTPADILAQLLTVDGTASLLDADLLDGADGALYARLAGPIFTGTVTVNGGRPITLQSGYVRIKGEAGGWADAYGFLGSAGTDHEGFGVFGIADALVNYYIGTYASQKVKVFSGGNVSIPGGLHVGGDSDPGDNNLLVDGTIKGESLESVTAFSSGFAGNGYKVIETGGVSSLEIDTLRVRGTLSAYELEINKISSVNGGMIISIANAKCTTVSGTTIYFDEGIGLTIPFVVDDYIKAQQFTGTGVAAYLGKVTAVNAGNIVATTISGAPWNGMDLVQLGNSNTGTYPGRQSVIYLTAADTNNPYIEGHAGITAGLFTDATRKFRLGNLTGITDATLSPSGYGLYAQNVFLSGKIVASAGTIGGFTVTANELYAGSGATRVEMQAAGGFWAGADTFAAAQFSVTPAGALTAKGITELGTATIGGSWVGNFAVKGGMLWENSQASDVAGLYFNVNGYQDANAYFRNLFIYDGKQSRIAVFGGSGINGGGGLLIDKQLYVDGATTLTNTINVTGVASFSSNVVLNNTNYNSLNTTGGIYMRGSTQPLCITSMSTTTRDNLAILLDGMMIFNVTTHQPNFYCQGQWWNISLS